MNDVLTVDGNKVLVELEWEQIDSIVRNELRDHIYMTHREILGEGWMHPDDIEYNKVLLPALLIVYENWAGKEAVEKIKETLNADEAVRSAK